MKKSFHPLAQFAINYALTHGGVDRVLLSCALSGSTPPPRRGVSAYLIVADDILGTLVDDEIMMREGLDLYRLVPGYVSEAS